MSELNREHLLEQFRLLEDYLRRARRHAERPREDFLADADGFDASVRQLTVLFETSHNIAKHLISRYGWRAPESKAEAFEVLAEQGVISEELKDAFCQAARFRNLAVYQTAILRADLVYQVLQEDLTDFDRFLAALGAWLGDHPD
jgi:uncharacterized protein YutE (UPF0331/DUF86 family)